MAWDDLSDAWWMRPSPMNESRGGISAQAFQLGFQQRQQMLENSLMDRRLKLAESIQDAKAKTDLNKQEGFAAISSVLSEISEKNGWLDPALRSKFWSTARRFPGLMDDPSFNALVNLFKNAEAAHIQEQNEAGRNLRQENSELGKAQRQQDALASREFIEMDKLARRYGEELSGEPIGTRKIIKSEWGDEPTAVLTKVGEGKTPWHWQRWEDLNPQDQAAIRTKLGIGRDRLNLINKELAPLKAEKSKAKEGSSDWINAQKEIDRLERERAKIEEQMFRHKPTAVPVNPPAAAPAAAPAPQPLSVPSRQGVVAPTNVNEIVAPPWEETPQPLPEDEGTAQMMFPRPTTQEEFDLLPSGAKYTGKDGRIYRKP